MKLIFRYLKPFKLLLLCSIIFLFAQVMSDLGLPRLMSDMVDTGIQAGGIEQGAPELMSPGAMDLLKTFLDERDAAALTESYDLLPAGSSGLSDKFPSLVSMDVYILANPKNGNTAADKAYEVAINALNLTLQSLREASPNLIMEDLDGAMSLDLGKLYELMPLFNQMKLSGELQGYIPAAEHRGSKGVQHISAAFTRLLYVELGADLGQVQRDYNIKTGLRMLGIALIGGVAAILVGWFASRIATSVGMRIRRDVFEKVGMFSNAEFNRFSSASLITRTTNDIQQIQQMLLMSIRLLLFAPIMGIGGIILAIRSSVSMSWIIAVAVLLIVGLILVLFSLAVPKFKVLQKLIDRLNLISRENLSGMMVIRAFGNEMHEVKRFEQANDDLRKTNRFVQRTMAFLFPSMTLVLNLITLLVIWVGAHKIAASELQIGNMMAFMQYAMQIIMSFLLLSMMFLTIPRALASAERIQEVLDTDIMIGDIEEPEHLEQRDGITVEFQDVSFRYGEAEEDVLHQISFTAKPGQTTALIGMTGSGKSTLVNLIPRFYDVTKGQIMLNGTDIRALKQVELREHIGYVPQKGFLFSGDIASNIRYGKKAASGQEIEEALGVAQAIEFVDMFDKRLESPIAQGGANVSGGQRQRLAIARALIKKSPIYIFDDTFSALDLKTDAALRRALKRYTSNATVLVVAQRVSTIKDADQIIVLDQGRIVGRGTHEELLNDCMTYREIAESQLTKEELA